MAHKLTGNTFVKSVASDIILNMKSTNSQVQLGGDRGGDHLHKSTSNIGDIIIF